MMQPSKISGQNFRRVWRSAVLFLLVAIFLFLAIRAADRYRWSDWAIGDAQTMLSLKQWHEDGWIHNYLLFKPQGYSPVVDLLDEPGLRQHAHGISPNSSPRVGPRLWYTHYPPGYLIPFAALYELGLDNIVALRLFAIVLSLVALGLMYLVFERITSARMAFLAVLFYGLSPPFLGYADSLANMPIDDLLRFAFMYAVVMASSAHGRAVQQRWLVAAWAAEFVLSLSSFDSVFFVYAWLIGWDVYKKRGFRWKMYLIFAMAPLSAHGIQVVQNIWYLGFKDAITDLADTFIVYHAVDADQGKIKATSGLIFSLFNQCFRWGGLLVPAAWGVLHWGRRFTVTPADDLPSAKLLLILLTCGLIFPIILPQAGAMSYESRQFIPFISLLISAASWVVILCYRGGTRNSARAQVDAEKNIWRIGFFGLSGLLFLAIWINFALTERISRIDVSEKTPEINAAERLKAMPTRYPPVFFNYKGLHAFQNWKYVQGYPQISPLIEYYVGAKTVLCFDEPDTLAQDIAALVRKTNRPFSPVLITGDMGGAKKAFSILTERGVTKAIDFPDNQFKEVTAIDLTDAIDWGSSARFGSITPLPSH